MLNDLLKKNLRYGNRNVPETETIRSWLPWKVKHLRNSTLLQQKYKGDGSEKSPFIIDWLDYDPENPQKWKTSYRWFVAMIVTAATLAVDFASSAYSGPFNELREQFHVGDEVITLGLSLYVLGFAVGPLIWAPLSEVLGRRIIFIITCGAVTAFNAGAAGSQNIWTLIILRFFAGSFGASPLTNAGGVVFDLFDASERGIVLSLFAGAVFLSPAAGPMIGGFVGENVGWRWVEGVMAIFTGIVWIIICFLLPETYSPFLLHERANELSRVTGKVYRSTFEAEKVIKFGEVLKVALSRPWVLLFTELIVFLLSIYIAIIYGTLFMLFGAFPIVYQQKRGWSEGVGGLAFIGVLVGMMIAVIYSILDNKRYTNTVKKSEGGLAPPEARLPPSIVGSICLPIGLFWFAWTNYPSIHWSVSIIASAPFGFGMVVVFISLFNYLIDAYTIYAASVLAANSIIRSIFGAVFPLFTTQMYSRFGIHWASCVPAFLALACVPFPSLFYIFGARIRKKSKYAGEAQETNQQTTHTKSNINKQNEENKHTTLNMNEQNGENKHTKVNINKQNGENKHTKVNINKQNGENKHTKQGK
jgi:multidrug resistance protein